MRKLVIKKGQKFNRLTILKEVKSYINPCNNQKIRKFLCQCDCGNKKKVMYDHLKSGHTKSCGCYKKELIKNRSITHGMRKTRFYGIWSAILTRCNNKNNKGYKYYGSRGIENEWKDFKNFKKDMYKSYLIHCKKFSIKQTTIERIDNDGNYCKSNCCWATCKEQANNRRKRCIGKIT